MELKKRYIFEIAFAIIILAKIKLEIISVLSTSILKISLPSRVKNSSCISLTMVELMDRGVKRDLQPSLEKECRLQAIG